MCWFLFFLCCLSVPLPALMMEKKKNKIKSPLFYDPFLFELLWLCLTFHSTLEMSFHSARHFVPSVMRRCRLSISKLRTRTRTHGAHPHTLALGNSLNHTLMHTHTHTRAARVELRVEPGSLAKVLSPLESPSCSDPAPQIKCRPLQSQHSSACVCVGGRCVCLHVCVCEWSFVVSVGWGMV